ncbi:hypothetical protein [Thomasclavelia cocleata]|uniref:hypothetical protein n=1 Tax=Thomasclavelia cocleata TaxID=69824 RepID=UPI00272E1448|nr:hypothetical protein [Thomasclavelia cocleata]
MFRIIRLLLALSFIIIAIVFLKRKSVKFKLLKAIICIIICLIIIIMPFENIFIKFSTPELAFKKTSNNCEIVKIIEKENTALIIYQEKSSTYATLINRTGDKWKAQFWPDKQTLTRLENGEIILVTNERKSNNFYIMVSVNYNTQMISDNKNSYFETFSSNDKRTNYVAYVENCDEEYIINIDNYKYQIM